MLRHLPKVPSLIKGLLGWSPPFHYRGWKWLRLGLLISADIIFVAFCYWLAFFLRLEGKWLQYLNVYIASFPIFLSVHILCFIAGGMYRQVWRYANIYSAMLICKCVFIGTAISTAIALLAPIESFPRSIPIIFATLASLLLIAQKFSWRLLTSYRDGLKRCDSAKCVVYGAGTAGELLARHAHANPNFPYKIVGFVDDDINKRGRLISGIRILGMSQDLGKICREKSVNTVVIAMHSQPGKVVRDIVQKCQLLNIRPLIMPNMAESLDENIFKPRSIDIKDLLRRSPKSIDEERVSLFFRDRTLLITGAGGSIGSEICRQVVQYKPKKVILYDSSEFNLYKVDAQLRDCLKDKSIHIIPILGSVTDRRCLENVFEQFEPSVILHAAAYKHVPLIEANPTAGIINNILGTKNVAECSIKYNSERFLLVSTDKAVNPTSIMGATKRVCELLLLSLYQKNPDICSFSAVRFGNVLGSSGSVIPKFLRQIKNGGPVTVTHPEVNRYFMLISEAVGLVLQSASMAQGGEIFVLNMGDAVNIYEMAKQLIRLSGKEPGQDIDIIFTGLRPGEKLFEELIIDGAERQTAHDDVLIAKSDFLDVNTVLKDVNKIIELALQSNEAESIKIMRQLVTVSHDLPIEDTELLELRSVHIN